MRLDLRCRDTARVDLGEQVVARLRFSCSCSRRRRSRHGTNHTSWRRVVGTRTRKTASLRRLLRRLFVLLLHWCGNTASLDFGEKRRGTVELLLRCLLRRLAAGLASRLLRRLVRLDLRCRDTARVDLGEQVVARLNCFFRCAALSLHIVFVVCFAVFLVFLIRMFGCLLGRFLWQLLRLVFLFFP